MVQEPFDLCFDPGFLVNPDQDPGFLVNPDQDPGFLVNPDQDPGFLVHLDLDTDFLWPKIRKTSWKIWSIKKMQYVFLFFSLYERLNHAIFSFFWVSFFVILDPDPDPQAQLNPDTPQALNRLSLATPHFLLTLLITPPWTQCAPLPGATVVTNIYIVACGLHGHWGAVTCPPAFTTFGFGPGAKMNRKVCGVCLLLQVAWVS